MLCMILDQAGETRTAALLRRCSHHIEKRKRRVLPQHLLNSRMPRLELSLPVSYPASRRRAKLSADIWPELLQRARAGASLRQLAREYGVSHETIRQALKRAGA